MTLTDEEVAIEKIDNLSNLHGLRSSLNYRRAELIKSVIPPEVQAELDAIEAEFKEQYTTLDANIADLEKEVRLSVLTIGHTVKGTFLRVEVQAGKTSWNTKALLPLTKRYPWLKDYQTVGDPFTKIVEI